MTDRSVEIAFTVTGMSCASCSSYLESELRKDERLRDVSVVFAASRASATTAATSGPQLKEAYAAMQKIIAAAGYTATPVRVETARFSVAGMSCASCAGHLESGVVKSVVGVVEASVVFASSSAVITYLTALTDADAIQAWIVSQGYTATNLVAPSPLYGDDTLQEVLTTSPSTSGNAAIDALERVDEIKKYRMRFFGAAVLAVPLIFAMFLTMGPLKDSYDAHTRIFNTVYFGMATPCVFFFGREFFFRAAKGLRHLRFTMDTLIAVGVGGAYFFSIGSLVLAYLGHHMVCYFETAASLVAFMLLGKFLEARAKASTSQALVMLMKLTPPTAILVRKNDAGEEIATTVPSSTLRVGDLVRVLSGERVPVDGVIAAGETAVDEAAITGESVPRPVGPSDSVVGGTINVGAVVTVKAAKVGADTVIAHIVRIVEDAQRTKPEIQRLADRIAAVFVPIVLVLAVLVFGLWILLGAWDLYPSAWRSGRHYVVFAFENFLSTLVVACPCALGLATPTAIMVGTGVGARLGVLVRSGVVLEAMSTINAVVFDKTGTLTTGKLRVVKSHFFSNGTPIAQTACAREAAAIKEVEQLSSHPVALAVAAHLEEMATAASPRGAIVNNHKVDGGRGVRASVLLSGEEVELHVGSVAYIEALTAEAASDKGSAEKTMPPAVRAVLSSDGARGLTPVVAAVNRSPVAVFLLADEPKPGAAAAIRALRFQHQCDVYMVTGDIASVANRIAGLVGIPSINVRHSCLPAEKANIIRELQATKRVAFVGDGINDSPALAQATVGIAMGAGTDVAIECADAVLMHDHLADVVVLRELARTVVRRIRLNFVWALGYNVVMIPVAAGLLFPIAGTGLPPMAAGAAMIFSSLSVLVSSLSLRWLAARSRRGYLSANASRRSLSSRLLNSIRSSGGSADHDNDDADDVLSDGDGAVTGQQGNHAESAPLANTQRP